VDRRNIVEHQCRNRKQHESRKVHIEALANLFEADEEHHVPRGHPDPHSPETFIETDKSLGPVNVYEAEHEASCFFGCNE
jgi:hypothetical protein